MCRPGEARTRGTEVGEGTEPARLRPDLLEQIARQALDKFFDHTLAARVGRYRSEWLSQAQQLIEATFDLDRLSEIRRDAEQQLAGMRQQIRELSDALRIDVDQERAEQVDAAEGAPGKVASVRS